MANAANTAWKLTDLWNTALFTFDSSWEPNNENLTAELTGEEYNIPWDNLAQRIDYGLGKRPITLQGIDVSDKDMWILSSAVCKRQLMKLWCGEDWFYYVLGVEPRQIRDQRMPRHKTYLASFSAMDPHYYFSNSAAGSGSGINWVVPTTVVGSAWAGTPVYTTLAFALTGSGADEGTTDIEPIYWFIGGTNTAITEIEIRYTHQLGRKIVYTPKTTIGDGHVHVIMPSRNTVHEGYMVENATGFKVVGGTGNSHITEPDGTMGGSVSTVGTWAMDAFNHGAGTDDLAVSASNTYGFIEEEEACIPSRYGIAYIPKNRNYPLALDGVSRSHRIYITGTETDCKVFAQYCVRRV